MRTPHFRAVMFLVLTVVAVFTALNAHHIKLLSKQVEFASLERAHATEERIAAAKEREATQQAIKRIERQLLPKKATTWVLKQCCDDGKD